MDRWTAVSLGRRVDLEKAGQEASPEPGANKRSREGYRNQQRKMSGVSGEFSTL